MSAFIDKHHTLLIDLNVLDVWSVMCDNLSYIFRAKNATCVIPIPPLTVERDSHHEVWHLSEPAFLGIGLLGRSGEHFETCRRQYVWQVVGKNIISRVPAFLSGPRQAGCIFACVYLTDPKVTLCVRFAGLVIRWEELCHVCGLCAYVGLFLFLTMFLLSFFSSSLKFLPEEQCNKSKGQSVVETVGIIVILVKVINPFVNNS